jgi:hypothetical protein
MSFHLFPSSILVLSSLLRLQRTARSRVSVQSFMYVSYLSHACYMPHLSHSPWLNHLHNIWWSVQVMKLLIMQSFTSSRYFLFSNTLNLFSSLSVRDQVSHPYKTTGIRYSTISSQKCYSMYASNSPLCITLRIYFFTRASACSWYLIRHYKIIISLFVQRRWSWP